MNKLFMILLGATPGQRNIEQHDIFFGIGKTLADLVPELKAFWPDAGRSLHIDAWREVTKVDDCKITVGERQVNKSDLKLFFINLGGYKPSEFDEYHYKMLTVAPSKAQAIAFAKKTAFYRHAGFKGANSHIDDTYGVDVDDIFQVTEILPKPFKTTYSVSMEPGIDGPDDKIHLGYFRLDKLTS